MTGAHSRTPVHAKFTIRRAVPADADGILECLGTAFEPYRDAYTPAAFADTILTREVVDQRFASWIVSVAESPDGTIMGTLSALLSEDSAHLRSMAVLPDCQGSGVARSLLAAVLTELRERGCRRVTLDTCDPLRRAMRFYETHGFRRTGQTSDFFGMPLHEYAMELR